VIAGRSSYRHERVAPDRGGSVRRLRPGAPTQPLGMSLPWATLGRGRLAFLLLALPAFAYVLVWRIAPALYTLWLSLHQYNIVYDAQPQWVQFQNYARLLQDAGLWEALRLSLAFALAATGLELILGMAAAAFFDSSPPGRNLLLGMFLLPMIMAPVVVGTVWSALFDQTVGPVPYLLEILHGPRIPWLATPLSAFFALVAADVWEWSPFLALLLFSAMQVIPREQYEAARVDGATTLQLFWRITLPQITGMMAVATGLRLMDAFLELDKVFVMTGGGPGTSTQFASFYIYKQAFQGYELGYASAVISGLLAVLAVVYALYLRKAGGMFRTLRA
jgi:multiple sugar transport system permease protein